MVEVKFWHFLKAASDVWNKPVRKKLTDSEILAIVMPYINEALEELKDHPMAFHQSMTASKAWRNYSRENRNKH